VDVVRHARVYGLDDELVVRDRHRRERRYRRGQGGIVRAVFVPPADRESGGAKAAFAERWGVVEFQSADRTTVLRIPLAEWLPEAGLVGLIDVSPKECLDRTGLRSLVAELGIPLDENPQSEESARSASGPDTRPDRTIHRELPPWHNWLRGIGTLVWFVFFIIIPMTGNGSRWTVLTAATGLFLVPATDVVARALMRFRVRRSDVALAVAEVIAPAPGEGSGATRRFCDTAAIRILPSDVVLTNTLGEERWILRSGDQGLARLVRLLDPASGAVRGVEFRDRKNVARALLPWACWFAGPTGAASWTRLVAALGLPVSDEKMRPGQQSDPWWRGHHMAVDARKMSPMTAKEARQETSWRSTVIGGGEPLVVSIFSLFPLVGIASNQLTGQLAGALAALTILAELAPVLGHQIHSRFKLDRPIESEPS
jgi:hypothetical protein